MLNIKRAGASMAHPGCQNLTADRMKTFDGVDADRAPSTASYTTPKTTAQTNANAA